MIISNFSSISINLFELEQWRNVIVNFFIKQYKKT